MPALNLGYLLRAASAAAPAIRQGIRERDDLNRQREIEDSTRLFNEWAKRNQADFQNRQLDEQSRLRQATIENTSAYNQGTLEARKRDEEGRAERAAAALEQQKWRTGFEADVRRELANLSDATRRRGQDVGALDIRIGTDQKPYVINPIDRTTQGAGDQTFPLSQSGQGRAATTSERVAEAQYELAKPAYDRLNKAFNEQEWRPSFQDKLGEFLKGGDWTPDALGNAVQSDQGQQMYDDLTALILASQYALSGKAVNKTEARQLARGLMPQLGDKEDRAASKRQEITTRLRVVMAGLPKSYPDERPDRVTPKPPLRDFLKRP